jgi:hypothetical protein
MRSRAIFPSVRSLRTSHRAVADTATIGHAERPAEFDLLNVPADEFAILQRQPKDPRSTGRLPRADS